MRVFLSHTSEEALEAQALKQALEEGVPGVEVFVSAVDIQLGDTWLEKIDESLTDAKLILALCSPSSIRRPWVNFETGSGWARGLPVVPVCHKGMRKDELPDPLGIFEAVELTSARSCGKLVSRLAAVTGLEPAPAFDASDMVGKLTIERPRRTAEVGVVLCHRQDEWAPGRQSIFSPTREPLSQLPGTWEIRPLTDDRLFLSPDLHELSGLVLGSPWRAAIAPETITAIVEWVRAGGRLLLLGFELGDRHHDANLAELSHEFGIDPAADIVGPPDYAKGKPYGVPVEFRPEDADEHPLSRELHALWLTNVQTVRVDPGGVEWLRVGRNSVHRPRRDSVQYHDGTMSAPGGAAFEPVKSAGWLPVAVEAPRGLCGAGGVHMVGTWDILGTQGTVGPENRTLVARLLDWLSGKEDW